MTSVDRTTPEPERWECPSCSDLDDYDCWHSPEMEPLARAIAAMFQETDEPTREQIGWFMDDADSLLRDVGDPPYEVVRWETVSNQITSAFTVNGVLCTVDNGEGQIEAQAIAKPRATEAPHV